MRAVMMRSVPGMQLGRPRALHAVRGHVAHAAVEAGVEPGAQAVLGVAEIDLGHADL